MLMGLAGMAIAQPLLETLSSSPDTFTFLRFSPRDLVLFALVVAFGPPLLLWAVEVIVDLTDHRAGEIAHIVFLAMLFAVFVLQVLVRVGLDVRVLAWILTGALTLGFVAAFKKFNDVSTWLMFTSVMPFVAGGMFLFASPVSDLVRARETAPPYVLENIGNPPPIIFVMLDELPTQSLMNADQNIDPLRFPNLAEFADQATWYRHFTSRAVRTTSSIPVFLTGLGPTEGSGHPVYRNNLFRFMGDSHDLFVSEAVTSICNVEGCIDPADTKANGDPSNPDAGQVRGADYRSLLDLSVELFGDRLDPEAPPRAGLEDFEEAFESATESERVEGRRLNNQPFRYTRFVQTLAEAPTGRPDLHFLHTVFPHQPWLFDELGDRYREPVEAAPAPPTLQGDWLARLTRQRHLLQVTYTDQLLGNLLEEAKSAGIYDEALIIVTADHGVAFEEGQHMRALSRQTIPSIAYTPMLIKAPGQERGLVVDANVSSVDLVPTVAAHLGVEVPWPTAGLDMNSGAASSRGPTKTLDETSSSDRLDDTIEFDDDVEYARLVEGIFAPVSSSTDLRAGLWQTVDGAPELIGSRFSDLVDGSENAVIIEVVGLEELTRPLPEDEFPIGVLTGWVDAAGGSRDDHLVVVSVADRVLAISEIEPRDGREGWFGTLVPLGAEPPVDFELGLWDPDAGTLTNVEVVAD